jgi:hypothetical protein
MQRHIVYILCNIKSTKIAKSATNSDKINQEVNKTSLEEFHLIKYEIYMTKY